MRFKKILSGMLICIILLHSTVAFANLAEEQKKLEQVKKEQQRVENQLKDVQQKKKSLIKELQNLNDRLNEAESKLTKVERAISVTRQELDKLTKELQQAEKDMDERNELFKLRIRNMYKNGGYGYLEVLLNAEDFGDFVSKFYLVSKVASYDVSVLEEMKEYRDLIQEKKDRVKEKEIKMLSLKNDLLNQKKEVQMLAANRNSTLNRVKSQEQMYEEMLEELERTSRQIEQTIIKLQSKGNYIGGKFIWPAPGYRRITSDFGYRVHPIYKTRKFHSGLDIGVPWGRKIVAAGTGTVLYADWYGGYGKTVMIDHGGGIVSLYAHNSSLKVKAGDFVKAGETIALAGSTGLSTGPHLHFEVRQNGKVINPKPWLGL